MTDETKEENQLPTTALTQPRVFAFYRWRELKNLLERCMAYADELHRLYKMHGKEKFAQHALLVFTILKEVHDRIEDLRGWA